MRIFYASLLSLLISCNSYAAVQSREISYKVDGEKFTGFLAFDDAIKGHGPGILVVHEWWGHNGYARKRAEMLAALGYTAFALDMYGTGKQASHPDDARKFMLEATKDPQAVSKRFQAGLDILKKQPTVQAGKIAVIGYCMGGGMALNMARAGLDVAGIAVFHGSLATNESAGKGDIKAAIMVFTGAADPFVPQAQVQAFEQEMKAAKAVYQLFSYNDAKHSFTNPEADDFARRFAMPMGYNAQADHDSWSKLQLFFNSIFK